MIPEEQSKSAEQIVRKLVQDAETVARHDPAKAIAAAVGVGVLLNILPTRFLFRSVASVASTIVRPTLITLGAIKAFEIYLNQTQKSANPAEWTESNPANHPNHPISHDPNI